MATKPIQYPIESYDLIVELRDLLSKERATGISLAAASTEATKLLLDQKKKKRT